MSPEVREMLLRQYERCRQEMTAFDAMLWQIASIAYAIAAPGAGLLILGKVHGGDAALVAALMLGATAPLTGSLIKNRLFQRARAAYARQLIHQLGGGGVIHEIPTTTRAAHATLREDPLAPSRNAVQRFGAILLRAVERPRAYRVMLTALLLGHIAEVGLFVHYIAQ